MTATQLTLRGHQPRRFTGQKAAILALLVSRRGTWVPVYEIVRCAFLYSTRIKVLHDSGCVIENRTKRGGQQVHGEFRLIGCPGDAQGGR